MSKPKQKKPEAMILYRCPYCGSLLLKSVVEVRHDDSWLCEMCFYEMRTA